MTESIKINTISVAEFRRLGYLQELNRRFLHPLGLALSVEVSDGGEESFGEIWDYRRDPEGLIFAEEMLDDEFRERATHLDVLILERAILRQKTLGYIVQSTRKGERDD